MARDFDWYVDEADDLIDRDAERDKMFQEMDRMVHLEYTLPSALEKLEWVRRFISTKPYDAVRAGVRVLAGREERLKIDPVSVLKALPGGADPDSILAHQKANEWERGLKWQMDRAARRRPSAREDVTRSAITYDEICGMVVHLPTQIRAIEKLGGNPKRQKAALAMGDFAVLIRNPQAVHVRYSDYMPEAVLYVRAISAQEIVDFWGKSAARLQRDIDNNKVADSYILYDYVDYEARMVWAAAGDKAGTAQHKKEYVILRDDTPRTFLPWACVVGGTSMESAPEHQRFPLLYGVYRAGQWLTANVLGTLAVSEAIAETGRPDVWIEGPSGSEGVEYEYMQPGGEGVVKPGHKITEAQQRGMDPQLREAFDRFETAMTEATLPRVLMTAEALPGEPFSGYNLRVQQAVASLIPYKRLSERWLVEAYRLMLLQAEAGGEDIKGYGKRREDLGKLYEIKASEIDPESIHLEVELQAEHALDMQQRVTTAITMSERLRYPTVDILEQMGETDPEAKIRQYMKEQFMWAELQGRMARIQAETSGEIQQMAQQIAQQMQQAAMEQAQAPQQGAPGGPPGMMGVGGMEFNPAEGGIPPAMAGPTQNVREMQTGATRLGEEALR